MHSEAEIVINGEKLTAAQAMTVRVAITDMLLKMSEPDALGKDHRGRVIAAAYRERAGEVQELIFRRVGRES